MRLPPLCLFGCCMHFIHKNLPYHMLQALLLLHLCNSHCNKGLNNHLFLLVVGSSSKKRPLLKSMHNNIFLISHYGLIPGALSEINYNVMCINLYNLYKIRVFLNPLCVFQDMIISMYI